MVHVGSRYQGFVHPFNNDHTGKEGESRDQPHGCLQSERRARLIERLEMQLKELEAAAAEDALAAKQSTETTDTVRTFTRRRPSRKPFPEHLPRERVVIEVPAACTCTCCGSDRLVKMGEDITETLVSMLDKKSPKVLG